MESDRRLDLVIDDLPGIGRRYALTGTNGGRLIVLITPAGAAWSTAWTRAPTRPRRWS